jgi:predicted membrane protein
MIYLYVNGIMSKVVSCDTNSSFNIASSSLNFNSNVCDIDLYKVRVYQIALDHTDIVRNYIADLRNINIYDANDITATDNNGNQTIDLTAIKTYNAKNPNNVTMPYAILKVNDNSV